jgi:hypothetical protein
LKPIRLSAIPLRPFPAPLTQLPHQAPSTGPGAIANAVFSH